MINDTPRLDKMLKLLALAKEGVGGERENAEALLDELLRRHGLTREDLERKGAPVQLFEFTVSDTLERTLLFQIAFTVLMAPSLMTQTEPRRRKKVWIEMTAAQHAEVSLAFDVYRVQWHQEVDLLMHAFVHKHRLFGPDADDDPPREPVDRNRVKAMMALMQGLSTVELQRRLAAPAQQS